MRTPLAPMSGQLMPVPQIGCRLPVLPASEDAHIAGEVTALTVPGENFVGRGTRRPDLRWSESGTKDAQPIFATTCSSRIHNC